MTRRQWLAGMMLLICGEARAWEGFVRHVPAGNNKGLVPLFLRRFHEFHGRHYFDQFRQWPPALLREFRAALGDERDLDDLLVEGWRWPRFQWGHEFKGVKRDSSLFSWFDLKDAAGLRARWRKIVPQAPKSDWVGVSWRGALTSPVYWSFQKEIATWPVPQGDTYEPFGLVSLSKQPETWLFRKAQRAIDVYVGGKKAWALTEPNQMLPLKGFAGAIQARLMEEFLILPRLHGRAPDGTERLFYP